MEIVVLKSAFFSLMPCVYILASRSRWLVFKQSVEWHQNTKKIAWRCWQWRMCFVFSPELFMHWISPSSLKRKFFSLSPLSPARSQHSKYSQHFGIFFQGKRAEPMDSFFWTEIKAFKSDYNNKSRIWKEDPTRSVGLVKKPKHPTTFGEADHVHKCDWHVFVCV